MGAYIVRRLLLMIVTLIGMSILIFVMLRLVPGDIADILVDAAGIADPKEKAKIAKELGLDRPIINYQRLATCWQPHVKGFVLHRNSIYNNWRYEDVWLDK